MLSHASMGSTARYLHVSTAHLKRVPKLLDGIVSPPASARRSL